MQKVLTATEKAAVLVANLDRHTVDMLLGQMSREQASAVRRAVIELDHLDPYLIEEVLEEFRCLNGSRQKLEAEGDVTWEPSGAVVECTFEGEMNCFGDRSSQNHDRSWADNIERRFTCLRGADPTTVARYFAHEHPQTIAVVFSHLSTEQSADVLARLPAAVQAEVLKRLADLEDTDPEVLRDIEASIEKWLREQDHHGKRRRFGIEAIQRILASAELGAKQEILANLNQKYSDFALQLGYHNATEGSQSQPDRAKSSEKSQSVPVNRQHKETVLPLTADRQHRATNTAAPGTIVELEFNDLEHLGDRALSEIFGKVEPEVIRIALAGAPSSMARRILSRLPATEQRLLERALARLGPLRISDVEISQRHLAHLATELMHEGKLAHDNPSNNRQAA